MQTVDLTTLAALTHELNQACLPARLEQVYQGDRHTIYLQLRTLSQKLWLLLSWHPQFARLHLSAPPPKQPDTFTFSQQILHQVAGYALISVGLTSAWERVVDLRFAKRPDDPVEWHLYLEVMGKYSNAILVNADGEIVTAAHQVSSKQSRVRPIQTGDRYELPPALLEAIPNLQEPFTTWRDRLVLIPKPIKQNLLTNYRGVSSSLVRSLLDIAQIQGDRLVTDLTIEEWQALYAAWQLWLNCLENKRFNPHLEGKGYGLIEKFADSLNSPDSLNFANSSELLSVNHFCDRYYSQQIAAIAFQQLHQQLSQAIQNQLGKLNIKEAEFQERLKLSALADDFKNKADLLMANSQLWRVGMTEIKLADFHSNTLIAIALDPTQNAIQNAQSFYKKHQKQKRAALAIAPLLESVQQEIAYLEQVATAVSLLEANDLITLQEIRLELAQQGYLKVTEEYVNHTKNSRNNKGLDRSSLRNVSKNINSNSHRNSHRNPNKTYTKASPQQAKKQNPKLKPDADPNFHHFVTPNGFDVLIGRNNYQNDLLSFRIAGEYDLWLHAQEISGSHVLLRLPAGAIADDIDVQTAANYAAYYSRARLSDRVPVVCTNPRYVFKPKGAKPGMVVYTHEKVIWGQPTAIG